MIFSNIKFTKSDKYQQVKAKTDNESDMEFVKRVRRESLKRQEIEVGNRKVMFGVEGPIIADRKKLCLVSAKVENGKWGTHYIIFSPDIETLISSEKTFLRLDSGCLLGMIFGDQTCDCLEQLRKAQKIILKKGGIIIHTPSHDGRGWGEFKMANQRIMNECNFDTITTAIAFYRDKNLFDQRCFKESVLILKALGFPKRYEFDLGTKNSMKESALIETGFTVFSKPVELKTLNGRQKENLKAKYNYWNKIRMTNKKESV